MEGGKGVWAKGGQERETEMKGRRGGEGEWPQLQLINQPVTVYSPTLRIIQDI